MIEPRDFARPCSQKRSFARNTWLISDEFLDDSDTAGIVYSRERWSLTENPEADLAGMYPKLSEWNKTSTPLIIKLSEEYGVPAGRRYGFQHGTVTWTSASGTTQITYN